MPPCPPSEDEPLELALARFREAYFAGQGPEVDAFVLGLSDSLRREELRREIEAFLSVVNVLQHASREREERPQRIGPFHVLEAIGEGGMGIVYLAEQREPVRRRVALKVLRAGNARASERERFLLECRSLALMNHDHIARLLEAGEDDEGQLYLAMEHVEGLPLTEFCRHVKAPLERRLSLFQTVCEAVHHAHQRGIIHRDLKPTNVLALERRGSYVPKVIDFGLARFFEEPSGSLHTRAGQVLGTPEYMSPEQAAGLAESIDVRTDVYSLGTLLYELLTGGVPFPGLRASSPAAIEQTLRDREPERPSKRLRRTGRGKAAWRRLEGDLDVIVAKALAKEPDDRYQSARELGEDVRRHLENLPLRAVPPSALERCRKLLRRRRYVVLSAVVVSLALLIGGVSTFVSFLRVRKVLDDVEHVTQPISTQARLREAREALAALPPPWPSNVDALQRWLREHGEPLAHTLRTIEANRLRLVAMDIGPELRSVLVHALDDLEQQARGFVGRSIRRVQEDLAWAERVEHESLALHGAAWERTLQDVRRSRAHTALELVPQMGLVPLGIDPRSGLHEFAHVRSGSVPRRGERGGLVYEEDAAIVFVLIPGGAFLIGAQPVEPGEPGYDPEASVETMPVREVVLDSFLLAKHEMTQSQWAALSFDERPAHYPGGEAFCGVPMTGRNPVENVSHEECERLLTRFGLRLPTEAQWEYGCRAGTRSRFCCGDETSGLDGFANLADRTAHDCRQYRLTCAALELEDGHGMHAPVGSFSPNAFGLHDMHGNVFEWCDAFYGSYRGSYRPGDGFWPKTDQSGRIFRGGSFSSLPREATSARRQSAPAAARSHNLGLRACRNLQLGDVPGSAR